MSLNVYLAYLLAVVVLVIIPGPSVTLVIGNSLRHGMRAGLLNVGGTQIGLAIIIGIVGLGLASVAKTMGWWFDWLRLAGAAYLIWLGWKLLRSSAAFEEPGRTPAPRGGFFLQGLLVSLSNPKTLVFFGAFIPQFIDPAHDTLPQVAIMGLTFMGVAALSDSLYAVLSGGAGRRISQRQARWMARAGGGFLIGGGLWLSLTRVR